MSELELPLFAPFAKIPRWSRHLVITEKIDGTNGQVLVLEDGRVLAGSRNRWLSVDGGKSGDNFGFARWVKDHEEELRDGLGVGRHYGEWWGQGIQRNYGLTERRFSLFNTGRWGGANPPPACCHVVPLLDGQGSSEASVEAALARLTLGGSLAAPGFGNPEGIVIFHSASGTLYKKTLDGDGPKLVAEGP